MKPKNVIKISNLPNKIPVIPTITVYLLMDKLNPSMFVWGIVGTLWSIVIIISIYGLATQKQIDIFDETRIDKK